MVEGARFAITAALACACLPLSRLAAKLLGAAQARARALSSLPETGWLAGRRRSRIGRLAEGRGLPVTATEREGGGEGEPPPPLTLGTPGGARRLKGPRAATAESSPAPALTSPSLPATQCRCLQAASFPFGGSGGGCRLESPPPPLM